MDVHQLAQTDLACPVLGCGNTATTKVILHDQWVQFSACTGHAEQMQTRPLGWHLVLPLGGSAKKPLTTFYVEYHPEDVVSHFLEQEG